MMSAKLSRLRWSATRHRATLCPDPCPVAELDHWLGNRALLISPEISRSPFLRGAEASGRHEKVAPRFAYRST
jgi:hypothetical protein